MEYSRVMSALRRRRWAIVLAVAACTGLTYYGSTRLPREYAAAATLMAQDEATESVSVLAKPIDADQDRDDLSGRQDRIKTVAAVLSSPTVLSKVIRELHLKVTPAQVQERLEVKELTSQVLRVTVRDGNPQLASEMVNRFVATFVDYYTDLRSRDARSQLALLERERVAADRDVREAAARLESFKRRGNISSLAEQTRVDLEHERLTEQERNKTEAQFREVSARLASVSQQLDQTSPTKEIRESGTQTKLLEKLGEEKLALQAALTKEQAVHTDEHPNVRRLKEQLARLEEQQGVHEQKLQVAVRIVPNPDYDAIRGRILELRNEREGLSARLARLNADLSQIQSRVSGYAGKDVELSPLMARYNLAEQRLTAVTARLDQIRGAANQLSQGPAIAVVDRSGADNPPLDLSQGRTLRLTALAFLMSLVACIAVAISLDMADQRVRSVDEAEARMQLPVISVVPQLGSGSNARKLCLTAKDDPSSHLAESYHFLANHVLRQTMGATSSVITAITARPGQGATTALSNLAVALARAGRRVVLVEADLRRPYLHRVFSTEERPGLTDVLQGRASIDKALAATEVENLSLLPAGREVADPWSLLWQPRMATTLDELREQAEFVLINVPSATVFPDALCIAPHADGAILVVRSNDAMNGAEHKVRQWLEEVQVPVMGMVLNGTPAREMDSYRYHRDYRTKHEGDGAAALPLPPLNTLKRAG